MSAPDPDPAALDPDVLASILDASLDGIVLIGGDRSFVFVNPAAARILGHPAEALLGRDYTKLFPERVRAEMRGRFDDDSPEQVRRRQVPIVRADGEEREIEFTSTIGEAGGELLVAAIFRDVTDARRRERESRTLAHIAASLTIDQPMDATLDALTRIVVDATRATAATIGLIEPETLRVERFTSHGLPREYMAVIEATWPLSRESATARAVQSRQIQVAAAARTLMAASPAYAPVHHLLDDIGWEAMVAVPLVARGKALGALNAFYPAPVPPDAEIALLAAIADQAAIVVENARLYADAQGRATIEERQRLARELHDSVSQALYGIALGTRTARELLDSDPRAAVEPVEYVISLAEAGLAEMRALIFELRPESLATEGLVAAVERHAAAVRARYGVEVVASLPAEPDVPLAVKETVYRIVQEGLHNVVRHASAARIDLAIAHEDGALTVDIRDDGVGFAAEDAEQGRQRLHKLRDFAARTGGSLTVESAPDCGAHLRASIPVPAAS